MSEDFFEKRVSEWVEEGERRGFMGGGGDAPFLTNLHKTNLHTFYKKHGIWETLLALTLHYQTHHQQPLKLQDAEKATFLLPLTQQDYEDTHAAIAHIRRLWLPHHHDPLFTTQQILHHNEPSAHWVIPYLIGTTQHPQETIQKILHQLSPELQTPAWLLHKTLHPHKQTLLK